MKFEISPKSTETVLDWQEAILYCLMLDIDGFGWRLPTKTELNQIYNSKNNFEKDWYWTCTESSVDFAWLQNFINGFQYYGNRKGFSYYVRAVRSII